MEHKGLYQNLENRRTQQTSKAANCSMNLVVLHSHNQPFTVRISVCLFVFLNCLEDRLIVYLSICLSLSHSLFINCFVHVTKDPDYIVISSMLRKNHVCLSNLPGSLIVLSFICLFGHISLLLSMNCFAPMASLSMFLRNQILSSYWQC